MCAWRCLLDNFVPVSTTDRKAVNVQYEGLYCTESRTCDFVAGASIRLPSVLSTYACMASSSVLPVTSKGMGNGRRLGREEINGGEERVPRRCALLTTARTATPTRGTVARKIGRAEGGHDEPHEARGRCVCLRPHPKAPAAPPPATARTPLAAHTPPPEWRDRRDTKRREVQAGGLHLLRVGCRPLPIGRPVARQVVLPDAKHCVLGLHVLCRRGRWRCRRHRRGRAVDEARRLQPPHRCPPCACALVVRRPPGFGTAGSTIGGHLAGRTAGQGSAW